MRKIDKVSVTDWLKHHGRDREWLALQCNAEIGTVNSWFSTRGFSDSAQATIDKLMKLDEIAANHPTDETGLIQFTAAEFELLEKARAAVGAPSRPQFYRDAILQYVEELNKKG